MLMAREIRTAHREDARTVQITKLLSFASLALVACGGESAPPSTPAPPTVTVASVTVSPPSLRLTVRQSSTLSAEARDASGAVLAGQTVSWASADEAIASVGASGVVTGIAAGTTTVTATAGGRLGAASITVVPISVSLVSLDVATVSLQVGQVQQLAATPKDSAGNALVGRTIAWSSANTDVATVSASGVVSAIAVGTTTVSATSEGVKGTAAVSVVPIGRSITLDFSRELLGTPATLSAGVQAIDVSTKTVVVNGVDAGHLVTPFTFVWDDGSTTTGFFPQTHAYSDGSRNYVARVVARYSDAAADSVDVGIRFVAPQIAVKPIPSAVTVSIPRSLPTLSSRMPGYAPSPALRPFSDAFFTSALPRETVEYVLSHAAAVEASILENDIERVNGEWRQIVLNDPAFAGAYSLWFTSPIAFAADASFFQGTPGYSSLFHEMGHNFSLNAPAAFRYGGRIDGNANAIFSESVAQMFQHAVAYELVNNAAKYGLPADLAVDIAASARASAQGVRRVYDAYIAQGKPFTSWNIGSAGSDATLGTFITVARQFMVHAESAKAYVAPLTRTMRLLRTFNASLAAQYAPQTNSPTADTFRATLMVAAISYGFQLDLRAEFRALNFPIDDATYASLVASVP